MTDIVLLTSAYLAPVHYYAKLYAADYVVEERHEHYVKQTYRNRCVIAGPGGPQALTIPVEKRPSPHTPTCDIRISDHGNWRHLHWQALVTAYESSPFFEYYADDLRPCYERRYTFLVDFNEALRRAVCDALEIKTPVVTTDSYVASPVQAVAAVAERLAVPFRLVADSFHPVAGSSLRVADFRERIRPKGTCFVDETFVPMPYYQVFWQRHGFLPGLSVADLLFNMGPEARLVLRGSNVQDGAATDTERDGGK